jgi:hypothetical protein
MIAFSFVVKIVTHRSNTIKNKKCYLRIFNIYYSFTKLYLYANIALVLEGN